MLRADPCGGETWPPSSQRGRFVKNAFAMTAHRRSQLLLALYSIVAPKRYQLSTLSVPNRTFREGVVCASREVVVKYLKEKPHVSYNVIGF